ncbi:putative urea ABC transporter/ substrate bindingdomain protein [Synechococcus sp. ROS8604]|nr:putative urea ABC transporter/ substrate bindingdomain protein [Synechococcus sp. ROS8604]
MPQALIGTRIKAPQGLLTIMPSQRLRKCSLLERADPNGCFIVQDHFGVLDPILWNPALAETAGRQKDHSKT